MNLPALHRHAFLIHPQNLLELLGGIVRFPGNIHHISQLLLIPPAKGHMHPHTRIYRLQKRRRYFVLKHLIYFFMGDINDDIRVPLRHARSSKISCINTLSSIGYFTPFIS